MSRPARITVLLLLIAGLVICVRVLATSDAARWVPVSDAVLATRLVRALTIVFGLAAWFQSQSLIGARGTRVGSIGDAVHDWTAGWHAWFASRPRAADRLLIASSACIDLLGLYLLASALFGPSLRPGLALLLLFGIRQIAQLTTALPPPPGMIWRHPGVPSIFVTYDVGNDFFFSGHTALAVLGAIELAELGSPALAVAAGVVAALEILTVLVLRAHYTLDVISGLLAAIVAASLSSVICQGY